MRLVETLPFSGLVTSDRLSIVSVLFSVFCPLAACAGRTGSDSAAFPSGVGAGVARGRPKPPDSFGFGVGVGAVAAKAVPAASAQITAT